MKRKEKKILDKLKKIYEETAEENLRDIKQILKNNRVEDLDLIQRCDSILFSTPHHVSNKWSCYRKYVRTLFVKEAFSKFYPNKYLEISLYIDALVNILDDLLDEELNKQEKSLYVLELLRDFSLYHRKEIPRTIQNDVFHYFNKLLALAIAERHYINLIKKEESLEKIMNYSIKSFNLRSLDIDIFVEIALAGNNIKNKMGGEKIKKIARIFRAINLIKKDINDIKYDKSHNLETVITIMASKKKKYNFQRYILNLIDYYSKSGKAIVNSLRKEERLVPLVISNFYKMIGKEREKFLEPWKLELKK